MDCPRCATPASDDAAYCRECGATLGDARCASCGTELSPGAQFCRECGTPVSERAAAVGTPYPVPATAPAWRRPYLIGVAAVILIVAGVIAVGVLVFLGGGDDDGVQALVPEGPTPVPEIVSSLQSSVAALGSESAATDMDQMRNIAGPPDGFSISLETDDLGNTTRREEWFYYEIRTVFEFVDGRLVSNLPIESKYGQFYLAPVQYDPADFEMGVTWEELAARLPDPAALVEYELEPEYELDGTYYVGNQLLAFFDDEDRLIYLEALPLAPDEE